MNIEQPRDLAAVQTSIINNDKAYIKIIKNTKGYNWEIKLFEDIDMEKIKDLQEKLKIVNQDMIKYYGE